MHYSGLNPIPGTGPRPLISGLKHLKPFQKTRSMLQSKHPGDVGSKSNHIISSNHLRKLDEALSKPIREYIPGNSL